jgi:chromate transporter
VRYEGARWQRVLETGLRPVAAGMILAAVYVLLESLDGGWTARLIALASTATLMTTPVSPLLLISAGAAIFMTLHKLALI